MLRAPRSRSKEGDEDDRQEDKAMSVDQGTSKPHSQDERKEDESHSSPSSSSSSSPPSSLPPLKFRNYRPKDKSIKYIALPRPSYAADSAWLDAELAVLVESAASHDNSDVLLLNIAPRSINWDLKRDLAPKLQLLKKQTARALREIRQERIAAQQQDELSEGEESENGT